MQLADPEQLLECLSAQELLSALKQLKKINPVPNEQLELSFNESSTSIFNTQSQHQKQQNLNFELYMAKVQQNKPSKSKSNFTKKDPNKDRSLSKTNNKSPKPLEKSKTPRATKANTHVENKQKSYSPINRTPKRTNNGLTYKKPQKENIPAPTANQPKQKISQKSRQILEAKSKRGQVYVPIHQRQNKVLKQKQEKIARIQRATRAQKQLQQVQYTFKPSINDYRNQNISSKVTTFNTSFMKQKKEKQNPSSSIMDSHQSMQLDIRPSVNKKITSNKHHRTITQPNMSINQTQQPQPLKKQKTQNSNTPQQAQKQKKYKNSKFNILLDLIH